MKIWALTRTRQRITNEVVLTFPGVRPADGEAWEYTIAACCEALHLSRPVILQKHLEQLDTFSRTAFLPDEFLESVSFDRFELELFPEPPLHLANE